MILASGQPTVFYSLENSLQPSTVQYSSVESSTAKYGLVQYNMVLFIPEQPKTVWCSTVYHSLTQIIQVQPRAVQFNLAQFSTAQYSSVQYSTVLYSPFSLPV